MSAQNTYQKKKYNWAPPGSAQTQGPMDDGYGTPGYKTYESYEYDPATAFTGTSGMTQNDRTVLGVAAAIIGALMICGLLAACATLGMLGTFAVLASKVDSGTEWSDTNNSRGSGSGRSGNFDGSIVITVPDEGTGYGSGFDDGSRQDRYDDFGSRQDRYGYDSYEIVIPEQGTTGSLEVVRKTVGDTVTFDDFDIVLGTDFTWETIGSPGIHGTGTANDAGQEVVLVPVTLKNTSDVAESWDPDYFTLYGPGGRALMPVGMLVEGDMLAMTSVIQPGETFETFITIPYRGAGDYAIQLMEDDSPQVIEITIPIPQRTAQ